MITDLVHNINQISKKVKLTHSMSYNLHSKCCVPYEQLIVTNDSFPNKYFLVHKNLVYQNHSLSDSSYEIFEFNNIGKLLGEKNVTELGKKFFREMKLMKRL